LYIKGKSDDFEDERMWNGDGGEFCGCFKILKEKFTRKAGHNMMNKSRENRSIQESNISLIIVL